MTQIIFPVAAKIPNHSCTSAQQAVWIHTANGGCCRHPAWLLEEIVVKVFCSRSLQPHRCFARLFNVFVFSLGTSPKARALALMTAANLPSVDANPRGDQWGFSTCLVSREEAKGSGRYKRPRSGSHSSVVLSQVNEADQKNTFGNFEDSH